MNDIETCSILGTPLAVADYAAGVSAAKSLARNRDRVSLLAFANTHVVALARRDATYSSALSKFDLIFPDGMPLVWVLNRRLAEPLDDRVYGPTFMLKCLEATQGEEWAHMMVGGSVEMLDQLQRNLESKFIGLRITGLISPAFGEWSEQETERIIVAIQNSQAQFVWVGLGCPKQEYWLSRNHHRLPPAVYSAVGAAFNFHAGYVSQAPNWMQKHGLEWLFRLVSEPRRLFRRYLIFNFLFVYYLIMDQLLSNRRVD